MAVEAAVIKEVLRWSMERKFQNDPKKSFPALFYRPRKMQRVMLESHAKTVFCLGANRSGKSQSQAVNVALLLNGVKGLLYDGFPKECEPTKWWCVAKTYKQAREVILDRIKWALGRTLVRYDEARNTGYLWNGSTFTVMSEDSGFEVFQGAELDGVWKDEIGDPVIFGECKTRLVDRNGVMLVSFTPTRGRDWSYATYYRPWVEGTSGEPREHNGVLFAHLGSMYDNPYLPKDAVLDMEKRCYSEEEKQIRMHGHYVDSTGLVFPNFDRNRHVVPPFEIPTHWPRFRGMDWGQRSPACCLWIAVDPDSGKHYVYREWYQKERTIVEICEAVKALSGQERYGLSVLDPSCWNREGHQDALGRDYTKALVYQMNGLPVVKAANDLQIGIDRMKQLLARPGEDPLFLIFDGAAPNLIRELIEWPWSAVGRGVEATAGNLPDKVDKKYDDHAIDCARYTCVATKLMVKGDIGGFSTGDATGFEAAQDDMVGSVIKAVPEKFLLPSGAYAYRMVRKRVLDSGFDEGLVDPNGGFD